MNNFILTNVYGHFESFHFFNQEIALVAGLGAWEDGDPTASEELLALLYEELRKIAGDRMAREGVGHTLQPTALVHEVPAKLETLLRDNDEDFFVSVVFLAELQHGLNLAPATHRAALAAWLAETRRKFAPAAESLTKLAHSFLGA